MKDADFRKYLATPAYKTLHKATSYVFGNCVRGIINTIEPTGPEDRRVYDLTPVEILFQPFVDALTVAFEEYSDSVDGPKLALEMLASLVEGNPDPNPNLNPNPNQP